MAPTPTRTLHLPLSLTRLLPRQATTTVVVGAPDSSSSSSNSGLDGGAIAGIVIGSVVGILLLWWLICACTARRGTGTNAAPPAPSPDRQGWYDDTIVSPSRSRSRSRRHRHHHHHHHHDRHRSGSRRHSRSRRRPSTPLVEEKYAYAVPAEPRRPSAVYATYPEPGMRRSRSLSRGGGYYVSG
ncbi:hypothetical protein VTK26DRAFT_3097 [Humicola hyalothermophila]